MVAILDIHEVDAERRALTLQILFVLINGGLLRKLIAVNQKVYSLTVFSSLCLHNSRCEVSTPHMYLCFSAVPEVALKVKSVKSTLSLSFTRRHQDMGVT